MFDIRKTGTDKKFISSVLWLLFLSALLSELVPMTRNTLWWIDQIRTIEYDSLRKLYNPWYGKQEGAIRALLEKDDADVPILLRSKKVIPWFIPYYTAPRRVFFHSERVEAQLLKKYGAAILIDLSSQKGSIRWSVGKLSNPAKLDPEKPGSSE